MDFNIQQSQKSQLQEKKKKIIKFSKARQNWFEVPYDFALSGPILPYDSMNDPMLSSGSVGNLTNDRKSWLYFTGR